MSEKLARHLRKRHESVVDGAASVIQKTVRGFCDRRKFLNKRKAAVQIQAHFRGWKERCDSFLNSLIYLAIVENAIWMHWILENDPQNKIFGETNGSGPMTVLSRMKRTRWSI